MFYRVLAASLLASTMITTTSLAADLIEADLSNQALYDWKNSKLNSPDKATLEFEKKHSIVYIYDGIKVAHVEQAMDNFDRIEHLMFINTAYPSQSSSTGFVMEDEGCN